MSMPAHPVFQAHHFFKGALDRNKAYLNTFHAIRSNTPITLIDNGFFLFKVFVKCEFTSPPSLKVTAVWITLPYLLETAENYSSNGNAKQSIHWIRTHFMLINTMIVGAMIVKNSSKLPSVPHLLIDALIFPISSRYPLIGMYANRLDTSSNLIMTALYCIANTYPSLFDFLKPKDMEYLSSEIIKTIVILVFYSKKQYQLRKERSFPVPPMDKGITDLLTQQLLIIKCDKPDTFQPRSLNEEEIEYLKTHFNNFAFSTQIFLQHFNLTPSAFYFLTLPEVTLQQPERLMDFYDQLEEDKKQQLNKMDLQVVVDTANGIPKLMPLSSYEVADMNIYLSHILLHMDTLEKDKRFDFLVGFSDSGQDCSTGHLEFVRQQFDNLKETKSNLFSLFLLHFQQLKESVVLKLTDVRRAVPLLDALHTKRVINGYLSPFGFRPSDVEVSPFNFKNRHELQLYFLDQWIQNLQTFFTWFNGKKEQNWKREFDQEQVMDRLIELKIPLDKAMYTMDKNTRKEVDISNPGKISDPTSLIQQFRPWAILAIMISMNVIDFVSKETELQLD